MWSMWSFICAPKCACSKQTLKGEVSWVRERREERGESSKKRELQGIEKKFRASIMASMLSSCIIRNRYCYYYYGTNRSSLLPSIAATNQSSESSKQLDRGEVSSQKPTSRREMILRSSEFALLGAIFHFSGTKPNYLGVQKSPPALALCPATNNCISTSEGISDLTHYAPPWNYNPEDGRGKKKPVSRDEAMAELTQVIKSIKPDKFTPRIMEKKDDYIRVEYESPIMGFVDDVEFWFPPDKKPIVEYRSASRLGNFDFDVNKKRIKAIRLALEKKGWASEGTF